MKDNIIDLEIQKMGIKTNHILHLILTLLTGIWVIAWIVIVFRNKSKIQDIENQIKILKLKNDNSI